MKQAAKLETQLIDFRAGEEEGRKGIVEMEEMSSFVCLICPHILMGLTGERCREVTKYFSPFSLITY